MVYSSDKFGLTEQILLDVLRHSVKKELLFWIFSYL